MLDSFFAKQGSLNFTYANFALVRSDLCLLVLDCTIVQCF